MANTKTVTAVRVTTSVQLRVGMVACFAGTTEANATNSGTLKRYKNSQDALYCATIAGTQYVWNVAGECLNASDANYHLYIIDTTLISTPGGGTTRGGVSGDVATINDLNARDSFACYALQALIAKHPDPIDCDSTVVTFLANKAYDYANAMMLASAVNRSTDASESQSTDTIPVDSNNLNGNTEKILYNINETLKAIKTQDANQHTAGIKIATFTPTLKVDNPDNDEFDVNGGGGGIDAAALKAACENNLNWQTLPNGDLVSIVGFEMKDGYRVPAENSISKLMTLLEAQELITSNNSVWYWLRKAQGGTTITDITTFLTAYGQDIFTSLKSAIDTEINDVAQQGFASGGNWRTSVEGIISSMVKSEALNP